jgi:hypothetical protein
LGLLNTDETEGFFSFSSSTDTPGIIRPHFRVFLLTIALCRRDASSYTVASRFGCQPCGYRIRYRNAL